MSEEQKQIEDHLENVKKEEKIVLRPAQIRNVIFVGRTRSGKSTALRVLKSTTAIAEFGSLYSVTQAAQLHSFTVDLKDGDRSMSYTVNLIDTPGLFEVAKDDKARNNEIIKNTIAKCLDYEITKIHAIFFVCSFEGGVNSQDVESLLQFLDFFGGASDRVAMLITRSEDWREERKNSIKEEISRIPQLQPVYERIKDRIFFIGSLDEDTVEEDDVVSIEKKLWSIVHSRNTIYEWLFAQQKFSQLSQLAFYEGQKVQAAQLVEQAKITHQKLFCAPRGTIEFKTLEGEHEKLFDQLKLVASFVDRGTLDELQKTAKVLFPNKFN